MPAVPWSPLHGRERELAAVNKTLAGASRGRFQALLLEGEAGIGKSRLLVEAAARADRLGFRTYSGCAAELEAGRPFGPIAEALGCTMGATDPVRAEIAAHLSRRQDGAPDAGLRFRIVDGLVELLEALSLQGPVAVALDDLHWVDTSTLMTVAAVARRLSTLPLAILVAFRPSPTLPDLQRLLEVLTRDGARHLTVGPLDSAAVDAMVEGILGARPGPRLLARVRSASGNPLFVGEMLVGLRGEGLLEVSNGEVEVGDAPLPSGLRQTILRRLSFVSRMRSNSFASPLRWGLPSTRRSWRSSQASRPRSSSGHWMSRSGPGCWRPTTIAFDSATN